MKFLPLLWASLTRRKTRLVLPLLSVVFACVLFDVLLAVRQAFTAGVSFANANRLITMSAVSLVNFLSISYGRRIASVNGVEDVSAEEWSASTSRIRVTRFSPWRYKPQVS